MKIFNLCISSGAQFVNTIVHLLYCNNDFFMSIRDCTPLSLRVDLKRVLKDILPDIKQYFIKVSLGSSFNWVDVKCTCLVVMHFSQFRWRIFQLDISFKATP